MRNEEKQRQAIERDKNQKLFKQQMRERKIKEEELYQMYKAEMEQEDQDDESSEFSPCSPKVTTNNASFATVAADVVKKFNKQSALESSQEHKDE